MSGPIDSSLYTEVYFTDRSTCEAILQDYPGDFSFGSLFADLYPHRILVSYSVSKINQSNNPCEYKITWVFRTGSSETLTNLGEYPFSRSEPFQTDAMVD